MRLGSRRARHHSTAPLGWHLEARSLVASATRSPSSCFQATSSSGAVPHAFLLPIYADSARTNRYPSGVWISNIDGANRARPTAAAEARSVSEDPDGLR